MRSFLVRAPLLAILLLLGCQPPEPQREKNLRRAENPPPLNPAFEVTPLPDFAAYRDVATKKATFFAFLEPLVAEQNRRVERLNQHLDQLQTLLDDQNALHPEDASWIDALARRYEIDTPAHQDRIYALREKLGSLPPALVLAQAANESAWGTSRFAREGNNLFGQWCFKQGCGLTPRQRGAGNRHEVAAYDSVAEGVHRYFVNLNSHASYAELRAIRRCLDKAELPLRGRALAAGLDRYSARGNHYVKELQAMIRTNALEPWPKTWWGDEPEHPCYPLVQVAIKKPDPLKTPPAEEPTEKVTAAIPAG